MRYLEQFKVSEIDVEQLTDEVSRRLIVGKNVMLQFVTISKETHPSRHHHPHEQIIWITSGVMHYRLADEEVRVCEAGSLIVIPGDVSHETWFEEDTDLLEIFSPVREDLLPSNRREILAN